MDITAQIKEMMTGINFDCSGMRSVLGVSGREVEDILDGVDLFGKYMVGLDSFDVGCAFDF